MKKPLLLSAALTLAIGLVFAQDDPGLPDRSHLPFFADSFEGLPAPPPCSVPEGFRVYEFKWEHVFFGASYPMSTSFLDPVGSFTFRNPPPRVGQGAPIKGRIITVPFTSDAAQHAVRWYAVQPVPAARYGTPNKAIVATVTVSQCRGDVYAACQATAGEGRLFYGPVSAQPECRIEPNKTYWLSWHFSWPDFDPTTNTCVPTNPSDGTRCDVNMRAN